MKFVGKFGNTNPIYDLDWTEVTVDPSATSDTASLSGNSLEKCTLTGLMKIDFYLSHFGTEKNPQTVISKIIIKKERVQWTYLQKDVTTKQSFPLYLNIAFHELPQDTTEFIPTVEFPRWIPRNILYPFYVYEDSSTILSVGLVSLVSLIMIVM
jgi:hypothetical protein